MNKNILVISSSRADRGLLEPISKKLGDECIFKKLDTNLEHEDYLYSIPFFIEKVVLLGDRRETVLLSFSAIESSKIIYHIHGGEVTAGSKDEIYRHAISKMAQCHLTSHQDFADRVIRMGETPKNVFVTGALGVHRAKQITLPRKEDQLTVILHPNTIEPEKTESEITTLLTALKSFTDRFRIKFYAPNYDNGREIISRKMRAFCELYGCEYIEEEHGDDFLRSLASSKCIIGNSSCGIIEAPTLRTPVVNIGERQEGRPRASSVMQCDFDIKDIQEHIFSALNDHWLDSLFNNPYDNVERDTVDMICDIIRNHPVSFKKRFID
jgi:UDP-hydrolysing UDP-N-acetyl-D-glucosamine 2-epimerase